MPLKIVRNNIINVKADAIVNTANPYPVVGSGVDTAIYEAAGREELLAARKAIGEIPPGQAAVTSAFKLNAKYIIHAVSPIWRGGHSQERMLLKSTYENIMRLALEHGCKSVAMPLLATGNNHFPKGMSLELAQQVAEKYIYQEDDFTVYIVVYDRASFSVASEKFHDIESYIDEHYVGRRHFSCFSKDFGDFAEDEDRSVHREQIFANICYDALELQPEPPIAAKKVYSKWPEFNDADKLETFSDKLFALIVKKGYDDADVYKNSNIDRRLFRKLRGKSYKPSKKTVLALTMGLKLNVDEATDLMKYAGFAFAPGSITDLAVLYCLETGKYNVVELNIFLVDHGEAPLN